MTSDVAAAARQLVAGDSAAEVAAGAVRVCEQLSRPLARLVGEIGTRTLLARSAALSSARFPWLANTIQRAAPVDAPWASLKVALEQQAPHVAADAFADLLSTLVALLGRLIGEGLVAGLLHEVWPELFRYPAKEAT